MKILANIEVVLKKESHCCRKSIIPLVEHFLKSEKSIKNGIIDKFDAATQPILHSDIKAIVIQDLPTFEKDQNGRTNGLHHNLEDITYSELKPNIYLYSLDETGPMVQTDDDEEQQQQIATHLMLPSAELYNLWENLYYEDDIKSNLLKYAQTMLEFSDKGVDPNTVVCNRVILLHGPPGTGKTSLCKAIAQKLAIRLQNRYQSGVLIEINSHSLFSKWFSESGKLVTRLFAKIREVVENPDVLVCVLIDEVESLARARNQCLAGSEPSDAIRVVNAVLTQIDQIRRYTNVLILTTSNISESIDLAFIDRADIKQFLGLPAIRAIRQVYESCLEELVKTQVILLDGDKIATRENIKDELDMSDLARVCEKSVGLSGRTLRKIPFVTHALFTSTFEDRKLAKFVSLMDKALDREIKERQYFNSNS